MKRGAAVLLTAGLTLCALALALRPTGEGQALTGRYLRAEDGTALLVTEDGEALVLTDAGGEGGLFQELESGDRVRVVCAEGAGEGGARAGVLACERLEAGSAADVPPETAEQLEALGWKLHSHVPAETAQTVADPVFGYCGNMVTTVSAGEKTASFWGGDSVDLTDLVINLDYDPGAVCRCAAEYTVDTEFGGGYEVSLREGFARCGAGQAALTAEQAETVRGILERNGCI